MIAPPIAAPDGSRTVPVIADTLPGLGAAGAGVFCAIAARPFSTGGAGAGLTRDTGAFAVALAAISPSFVSKLKSFLRLSSASLLASLGAAGANAPAPFPEPKPVPAVASLFLSSSSTFAAFGATILGEGLAVGTPAAGVAACNCLFSSRDSSSSGGRGTALDGGAFKSVIVPGVAGS